MFDTDPSHDPHSARTTRRAFLAGSAAVALTSTILYLRRPPGVEASTAIHGTAGQVEIASFADSGNPLGNQTVAKIVKTDGDWYKQLGRGPYGVTRQADTEMPYTGATWNEHRSGLYRCLCCDTALFSSQTKFDSHTGWPSFYQPIAQQNVTNRADTGFGQERTEVICTRCEAHLGHVFNDGPDPTGLRYCMNSASMRFIPA